MTKEQIVEIMQKYELKTMGIIVTTHLEEIADAILALPIEMPNEEEIEEWAKTRTKEIYDREEIITVPKLMEMGAKAMRDGEIIKKELK